MTSRIRHITFDCRDPYRQARFWAEVLGFVDEPDNPNEPDDPEALVVDPKGLHPGLLFVPVPEPKELKNRIHLDLVPDVRRDIEVDRLLELGATLVDDQRRPDGSGWAVLADPEGNELCVERSAAERPDAVDPICTEPVRQSGGERVLPDRAALESMLDLQRARVPAKLVGLAQHVAVAQPGPSPTSIAGLIKHLALVEDSWFSADLLGEPLAGWYADVDFDADPDWEFRTALDEPLALQLERYEAACTRARELAANVDLDAVVTRADGHPFTLRWLYLHMAAETARHLGHLDVLRELLDGTTGY